MLTAGLMVSMAWLAHGDVPAETSTDEFNPRLAMDLVGLRDVDFDSGWVPGDSPVQLRFYAHAADSIEIEMLGDGTYDWSSESIVFVGEPDGGYFLLDVGLELQASVRFDVAGITWESDILGPWDFAITSDALFTPYLLPGHPDDPVQIQDQTGGLTVASVPIIPDVVIASGNLDVDVAADITAELSGLRIEATHTGDATIVDGHGLAAPLDPEADADPMIVEGVLVTSLSTAPVLIVRPHLVMSIIGQDFEIFGIDIPIALPETDDDLVFDPETMMFDAPEPEPSDSSGGGESDGGGDDGVGDDGGGLDESGTDGGGSAGDDTGGNPECCDELPTGCGCTSGGPGNAGGLGLMLLALAAIRRRR